MMVITYFYFVQVVKDRNFNVSECFYCNYTNLEQSFRGQFERVVWDDAVVGKVCTHKVRHHSYSHHLVSYRIHYPFITTNRSVEKFLIELFY